MENYMKSLPYGDRNIVDERIKKETPLCEAFPFLFSAPLPKPVFVFLYGQGGDFNVLDAGPAVAALDEGDKGVEGGTLALGLQRDAAVPVVGDPAGQAQMQGRGAGIIAEAYALHCAGEAPAAADGAHASMPVTV